MVVIIEHTRSVELAQLIADAYQLTQRERQMVRLLSTGHARAEIARALAISPHTVDAQHVPRIHNEVPVGGTGWFLR